MLAVNPNDVERYPRDSPEAMRIRVENGEFEGVPYLYDESQSVARAYGAKTTPDVFVIDAAGVLRYRGAPDADHDDPAQNATFLRGALDSVLDGRDPNPRRDATSRLLYQVEDLSTRTRTQDQDSATTDARFVGDCGAASTVATLASGSHGPPAAALDT